jgi:hypothetical protein
MVYKKKYRNDDESPANPNEGAKCTNKNAEEKNSICSMITF